MVPFVGNLWHVRQSDPNYKSHEGSIKKWKFDESSMNDAKRAGALTNVSQFATMKVGYEASNEGRLVSPI